MSTVLHQAADLFFFIFHTTLILFNTFGWMFRRFRFYNLITLLLTAFSWFILGIWYGWGYCVCTDWHWAIRNQLGYKDDAKSYIDLLLTTFTGIEFDDALIDNATVSIFLISIFLSAILNIRDFKMKN